METRHIDAKILLISVFAVFTIELILTTASFRLSGYRLWLLAGARMVETGLLAGIVRFQTGNLACLGLTKDRILTGLYRGLLWSSCFAVFAGLLALCLTLFHIDPLRLFHVRFPAAGMVLFFVVGSLLGPVAEELFFRGVIYGYLRSWGFGWALLGSTAAFAAAHSFSEVPVTQIIGGLAFAVAYEIEKNLIVPIVVHVLGNTALFVITLAAGAVCMP